MKESSELFQSNRAHGNLLPGVFEVFDGGRMPCAY